MRQNFIVKFAGKEQRHVQTSNNVGKKKSQNVPDLECFTIFYEVYLPFNLTLHRLRVWVFALVENQWYEISRKDGNESDWGFLNTQSRRNIHVLMDSTLKYPYLFAKASNMVYPAFKF